MTFPALPRDLITELYLGGAWVDVTADVRNDPGVTITNGRPNESSNPQPASCSLVLNNRTGNYSPRNPLGAYYGDLGRNTPIRVGLRTAYDTFTRTTVNGWGTPTVGGSYGLIGIGGSVSSSDFQVTGGVGTMSQPATNGYRLAYLPTEVYRDVDVVVTVSLPFTNVTGGDVEPANILLRGVGVAEYYLTRLVITTAETITLGLLYQAASGAVTTLASAVTIPGLTHTAAQSLRVRAQIEAQTLRAKVWNAAGSEPYEWHVTAHTEQLNAAGWIGIRSGVSASNTNTLPIVFTYDNLTVTRPRFFGEISEWPQDWDISGSDATATVEAAGISRRLAHSTSVQQSTLYRGITALPTPPVAYWPAEDGPDATVLGSAVGGPPMIVSGPTDFASYSAIPSTAPIPTLRGGSWAGIVPPYTSTGQVQARFLLHSSTDFVAHAWMVGLKCTGGQSWDLKWQPGGDLSFDLWVNEILIFTTGAIGFGIINKDVMVSIDLEQNGANIDWSFSTLEVGQDVGFFWSGTTTSRTLGRAYQLLIDPHMLCSGASFGHLTVRKETTSLFDLDAELDGYRGESALNRIVRLCEQNDVSVSFIDDPTIFSALVGSQRVATLLDLLDDAVGADRGTLYDSRGELGLTYRERSSLYNQDPVFELDYSAGQVAPPFRPIDDDQQTHNDVTVTRLNGASARAELVTGRMSVQEPAAGGAGRYDLGLTLNVHFDTQLDGVAGFELRKGTVDDTRYPRVTVALHSRPVTTDTDLTRQVLDFCVDDKFTITNPRAGHTPDTIVQIGRGYTEEITNFTHTITINAAPAQPYEVLQLNAAAPSPGKPDTGGSALASGVTTAATTFAVTVTGTALWTTDAAHMPISVRLGGEVVTVTAITGTSSPQTFTVTRSTNGIIKAHAAGTALSLTHRPAFAL